MRTWDSPEVAEYAGLQRAAELRLVSALGAGPLPPAALPPAERAARELLALQSSDWAFIRTRELAGDYPDQRVRGHRDAFEQATGALERTVRDFRAMPGPPATPDGDAPADGRCAASRRTSTGAAAGPASPWGRQMTMRVLMLSWEYPPLIEGGLARHVRKLSENLADQGVEVHVLARGREESPAEEVADGVHLHRVLEPQRPAELTRVHHLGRAHEHRHAGRRRRAGRPLRLRPRPLSRLARGGRRRSPRQALRRAARGDDPRDRVRAPPGVGREPIRRATSTASSAGSPIAPSG